MQLDRGKALFVRMSEFLDTEWLRIDPVRVGLVPPTLRTPDLYVTVTDEDAAVLRDALILRVDVYVDDGAECLTFNDAIIWRRNLIVGFGNHVHAISMEKRDAVTIALDEYYCGLYPTSDYLLIASGDRLFRMEPDRSVLWISDFLGIDGVVVNDPGPPVVRGEGEFDPPGGWRPFAVLAADGRGASLTD
jgi:hypothetical protein